MLLFLLTQSQMLTVSINSLQFQFSQFLFRGCLKSIFVVVVITCGYSRCLLFQCSWVPPGIPWTMCYRAVATTRLYHTCWNTPSWKLITNVSASGICSYSSSGQNPTYWRCFALVQESFFGEHCQLQSILCVWSLGNGWHVVQGTMIVCVYHQPSAADLSL